MLYKTDPIKTEIELPEWMAKAIEHEAKRLNISPNDLIKIWIDEKLEGGQPGTKGSKKQ